MIMQISNKPPEKLSNDKLGIISNLRHSHMLEVLDALGLSSELFPLIFAEDIVTENKPDYEPFLKAIELAQCDTQDFLYVGGIVQQKTCRLPKKWV